MIKICLLITASCSLTIFAQTPLIAHKSHSGNESTYVIDPSANFGMVAPEIQQIRIINDTTIVKDYGFGRTLYNHDTIKVITKQIPIDLQDSLSKIYHAPVFIDSTNKLAPQTQEAKPINKRAVQPMNKKKSSSFLFILLFVSAGLLTTKIIESFFNKQKTAQ
jgi:hypothetical protein